LPLDDIPASATPRIISEPPTRIVLAVEVIFEDIARDRSHVRSQRRQVWTVEKMSLMPPIASQETATKSSIAT
jgi:hypothetical protein